MPRSDNPYRQRVVQSADYGLTFDDRRRAPRRSDTDSGPGMTAGDLDAMVRAHFQDGYAAAERAMQPQLDEARGRLAEAWDEGFTQGTRERRAGLAADLGIRVVGAKGTLRAALDGPKSKLAERAAAALAELDEVTEFANAIAAGNSIDETVDPT